LNSEIKRKSIRKKSILRKKKLVVIPIVSVVTIVLISLVSYTLVQTPREFSLKAAIIDQLGGQFPNATFRETATSILEGAGFNTTYYESQLVNVNFYQELAKQNYGIIILRSHSALRYPNNDTVDLFTSEQFNNQSYRQMWDKGYLSEGEYLFEQASNTPEFIENIEGSFPRSIVIAMGCWSLKLDADQMAQAFIDKGAEAYIGWTSVILPKDTDRETINLLKLLVTQNTSIAQAISQIKVITYATEGNSAVWVRMAYRPLSIADLTLSELMASAKSLANTTFLCSFQSATSLMTEPAPRQRLNGAIQQALQAADNAERLPQKADSATAPLSNHACATQRSLQQACCPPRLQ